MSKKSHKQRSPHEPPPLATPVGSLHSAFAGRVILLLLIWIAFAPLLDAKFVSMDDPGTIFANPLVKSPSLASIQYYWTHFARGLYAPLTYTLWIALAAIKLEPYVFHVANILIHVIATVLVIELVRELFKSVWPAVLAGALFAVHPLQVETVAWASGTKDLLAGAFGIGALFMYVRSVNRGKLAWYLGGTGLLLLGLLSKPSAMTIPGLALVIDGLLLHQPAKAIARRIAPWLALSALFAVVAWLGQPALRAAPPPLWARPLLVGDSITFYLWKLIFPLNLAICYARIPAELIQQSRIYFMWLVPAALLATGWFWRGKAPALLVAVLIFIIAPSPMLGLFRFDFQYYSSVVDHYVYVAMLGPALLAGWLLHRYRRRTVWAVSVALLLLLAGFTFRQAMFWKNDTTLLTHSLDVAPRGLLPLQNLGNSLAQQGKHEGAIPFFRRALEVRPSHYESILSLSTSLAKTNHTDEAIVWFRKFLHHVELLDKTDRPANYADFAFTFAHTLLNRGETEEAIHWLQVCVQERPGDTVAARDLEQARQRIGPARLP